MARLFDGRKAQRNSKRSNAMAYVPLDLSKSLPGSVHTAIRKGVEPLLRDVHWMFATVIGEPTDAVPRRQLRVPIALVLLATVDGVSTKLLHPQETMSTGVRFKECLNRYFPWDIDPPTGVSSECAAKILYDFFRNPLVHRLGWHTGEHSVVRIGQVFRGTDDPEKGVEDLERLTEKPSSEPCLVVTPDKKVLWLDPFYWGVRKLVERWSYDDTQVSFADEKLALRVVEGGGSRLGAEKRTDGA